MPKHITITRVKKHGIGTVPFANPEYANILYEFYELELLDLNWFFIVEGSARDSSVKDAVSFYLARMRYD